MEQQLTSQQQPSLKRMTQDFQSLPGQLPGQGEVHIQKLGWWAIGDSSEQLPEPQLDGTNLEDGHPVNSPVVSGNHGTDRKSLEKILCWNARTDLYVHRNSCWWFHFANHMISPIAMFDCWLPGSKRNMYFTYPLSGNWTCERSGHWTQPLNMAPWSAYSKDSTMVNFHRLWGSNTVWSKNKW